MPSQFLKKSPQCQTKTWKTTQLALHLYIQDSPLLLFNRRAQIYAARPFQMPLSRTLWTCIQDIATDIQFILNHSNCDIKYFLRWHSFTFPLCQKKAGNLVLGIQRTVWSHFQFRKISLVFLVSKSKPNQTGSLHLSKKNPIHSHMHTAPSIRKFRPDTKSFFIVQPCK